MLLFLPSSYVVLINFTYYAQYYAHVKDLCLGSTLLVLLSLLQNKLLRW